MSDVWFTSDNHFGHKNIIAYCSRPFKDVHEMNRTMTESWNDLVRPCDTVYHLGDFSMTRKPSEIAVYRKKLHGRIVLIRGNHDRGPAGMREAGFDEVHDRLELELDGHRLYLAHIPVLFADPDRPKKYKEALTQPPPENYDYFLCGHVHEKWRRRGRVINVGVDQWGFAPVGLETLLSVTAYDVASGWAEHMREQWKDPAFREDYMNPGPNPLIDSDEGAPE